MKSQLVIFLVLVGIVAMVSSQTPNFGQIESMKKMLKTQENCILTGKNCNAVGNKIRLLLPIVFDCVNDKKCVSPMKYDVLKKLTDTVKKSNVKLYDIVQSKYYHKKQH